MTVPEIAQEIETLKQTLTQIDQRMEQLGALLSKVEQGNEVPNVLDFKDRENFYYVCNNGWIYNAKYNNCEMNLTGAKNHRFFKTLEYAKMFRNKSQFIADLLHFKWLYDRGFQPDWDNDEYFYRVVWRIDLRKYEVATMSLTSDGASVFFSTKEIAQRCADWLNSRIGDVE